MTTRAAPLCLGCQHFQGYAGSSGRCDAFPAGIPAAIWQSDADHRPPYPGDHGIRFAPRTPDAAAYAATLFPKEAPDV